MMQTTENKTTASKTNSKKKTMVYLDSDLAKRMKASNLKIEKTIDLLLNVHLDRYEEFVKNG
jgi:hypothetical protein